MAFALEHITNKHIPRRGLESLGSYGAGEESRGNHKEATFNLTRGKKGTQGSCLRKDPVVYATWRHQFMDKNKVFIQKSEDTIGECFYKDVK